MITIDLMIQVYILKCNTSLNKQEKLSGAVTMGIEIKVFKKIC
jgi:hypothetical protein